MHVDESLRRTADQHEKLDYEPLVAAQVDPDRRYALMRVGNVEYAYGDYDAYIRGMGQAWAAGLVPEPLPSTPGSRLPEVAPRLMGVDVDLADLRPADVASTDRFERRRA